MKLLADMHCVIHKKGDPLLSEEEIMDLYSQIPQWGLGEDRSAPQLLRRYKFSNFLQALEFTNKIGLISEEENHHPNITTEWGAVTVRWWTHTIRGLHKNDFIMAAKTDRLYANMQVANQ